MTSNVDPQSEVNPEYSEGNDEAEDPTEFIDIDAAETAVGLVQVVNNHSLFFLDNFYFFTKKTDFQVIFRLFTASVRSRPPGPPAVPGVFISVI